MSKHEFGLLRSRSGRKPWPECPNILIYRCEYCHSLLQCLSFEEPVHTLCCDFSMHRLKPCYLEDLPPGVEVDYEIVGGFNQNAVQIFWQTTRPEDRPDWVLLKTFTGSYLKYISAKKKSPVIFPLSDEDAYVYCDRRRCERCVFRCKKGFVAYLYFRAIGLLEVPLDKMTEYFKSKP